MHGRMLTRTLTFVKNNHFGNVHFSIHAPTRGATSTGGGTDHVSVVSIHAPTRGATVSLTSPIVFSLLFQSTRPRGARRLRYP